MSILPRSRRIAHVILLSGLLLWIIAVTTVPTVRADDGQDGQPEKIEPKPAPQFWERNWVLTELVGFPFFLLLIAGAMASNTRTETVVTKTFNFPQGLPIAKSYTDVTVPKEPSSPEEIKRTVSIVTVVYLVLRFSCGFGLVNDTWQFIGGFIDLFFSTAK